MEKVLKYTPIVYSYLIFLGYAYLHTYYNMWGIEIYPFLDISEILLSFVHHIDTLILISLAIFVLTVMPSFLVSVGLQPVSEYILTTDKRKMVYHLIIVSLNLVVIVHSTYALIRDWSLISLFAILYFVAIILFLVFYYFLNRAMERKSPDLDREFLQIIMVMLFVSTFNYMSAIFNYHEVEKGISKRGFAFSYNDCSYKSSDSLLLMGMTSKYIFLRNKPKEENYIFERERVSNLTLIKVKHSSPKGN